MDGLNSFLNLHGQVSPRVMPSIGEWGPSGVPTTRSKKRMRWMVIGLLLGILLVVTGLEVLVWQVLK